MKFIFFVFILIIIYDIVLSKKYPTESLKCYSYLTKPDLELICPAARNKYCVKEVVSLTKDLCGATQYYGDLYINKECQYKKCAAECEEGIYSFEFQGNTYSREVFCCKTDMCNSSLKNFSLNYPIYLILLIISCFFLFFTY